MKRRMKKKGKTERSKNSCTKWFILLVTLHKKSAASAPDEQYPFRPCNNSRIAINIGENSVDAMRPESQGKK